MTGSSQRIKRIARLKPAFKAVVLVAFQSEFDHRGLIFPWTIAQTANAVILTCVIKT
jgi:hypothetical protein